MILRFLLQDIEAGEELLTWFQPKKKKRKKSLVRNPSGMKNDRKHIQHLNIYINYPYSQNEILAYIVMHIVVSHSIY